MNERLGADGGAVIRCRRGRKIKKRKKRDRGGDKPAGETQQKNKRGKKITKYEIERGDRRDLRLR